MPSSPLSQCRTPRCGNLVAGGYCQDCQSDNIRDTRITVIAGAPCSGKTTFVQLHKRPGDLVIDLDALKVAIGSDDTHLHDARLLPFALAAQEAILERLHNPHDLHHVWIIRTAPRIKDRHLWPDAQVIILDPGQDTCLQRAASRPAGTDTLIANWYQLYEPHDKDITYAS
jgi:hypothetical protein